MRTLANSYRLSFPLPPTLVRAGGITPMLDGCTLSVDHISQNGAVCVALTGPSRERVFDQAAALLGAAAKDAAPTSIAAVLETPDPRGRDSWTIIVGADVAFSPTSLPPHLAALEHGPAERPPPELLLAANK